MASKGIIYEYEDGGRYCGEWESDAAHGHGVCTGPDGNGLFQGVWERGHQVSGVFTWPSGQRYMGKWRQGVREGAGKETKKDGTEYCGEFTRDSRGPFGVLRQPNGVVFRGTWKEGVQNGLGTELYIDGGMYRGEYLNGMRHGHGTRSSSNYERSTTAEAVSVNSSLDDSVENLALTLEDPSSVSSSSTGLSGSDSTSNTQIYEGEWKDDKRHGYGVLKIVGHHTYYGQWEENMRSGYGVMIYGEEKRKEEGQWQRGKLVQKLKRKKLQLKSKQLEAKVNQAHMNALQAAEAARSKADLAEGRANTANAKSRQALRAAQQALKDAETAEAVEKFYRNAPKVQESAKSPITDSYTTGDISRGTATPATGNLLEPPKLKIPLTPSFEDLASVDRNLSGRQELESSGSNESLEEAESSAVGGVQYQEAELTRRENPSPVPWRRKTLLQSAAAAKEKRSKFRSGRHSSADILLHTRESQTQSQSGSLSGEGDGVLQEKRKILLKIHQASESDPTISSGLPGSQGKSSHSRTFSSLSTVPSRSSSQPDRGVGEGEGELRPRHVNKATGEPDHGEVTDDEEACVKCSPNSSTVSEPRSAPKSVSVEVLQQMAHWNKMVAYLNLGLLFFLLLLIVTLVLCMNYYWLVYQLPASSAGAGGMDFGSPRYASGPMA